MSSIKQLTLVADIEAKKEQKCASDYQVASANLQDNKQKLEGLENYRLSYLKMIQEKGRAGVEAQDLHQHQSFVGKLDKACEQQSQFLKQASLVTEQRKRQWLTQQKKRKAVEHLIDTKKKAAQFVADKQEQQMFDEIALQKFVRRTNSAFM